MKRPKTQSQIRIVNGQATTKKPSKTKNKDRTTAATPAKKHKPRTETGAKTQERLATPASGATAAPAIIDLALVGEGGSGGGAGTPATTEVANDDYSDEPSMSLDAATRLAAIAEQLGSGVIDIEALRRLTILENDDQFRDGDSFRSPEDPLLGRADELENPDTPKADPTAYTQRQDRLFRDFGVFQGKQRPSGTLVIAWMESINAASNARTPGLWCTGPDGHCDDDKCCRRELSGSSWDSKLGCLAGHADLGQRWREAVSSKPVKKYLRARLKAQIAAGRSTTKADLISTDSIESICAASVLTAEAAQASGDYIRWVSALQFAAILSLDVATGRRNADISRADSRRCFFTTIKGQQAVILELLQQKVFNSPNLTVAFAEPGCNRDPVTRLKEYIAAATAVGLPLADSHLLFPKIAKGANRYHVWGLQNQNPKSQFDLQHASTKDMNADLKTMMALADTPASQRGFTIHGCRSAKVLVELDKGTDLKTLNKMLGWTPKSDQWQTYARLRQLTALLASPTLPAATVQTALQAQALVLDLAVGTPP
jgi:hypothetical protein